MKTQALDWKKKKKFLQTTNLTRDIDLKYLKNPQSSIVKKQAMQLENRQKR